MSDTPYCLYARKSSESDERQAMSIDSQIKEMHELAQKDGIYIKEVRQESHSAKVSGTRPVFTQLIIDIRSGLFEGILTWAPDRLSRNAGDLGSLVDLMDLGKLKQIRTYSQSFSNNPNEKFLLMILCSQAKLENDQKGLNVKRGIRAKCEMGWRPGMPPIGYWNRAMAGVKDIVVDPDRGKVITEMFERVAKNGDSGRTIKKWFSEIGMTTRAGKGVTLSQIYAMLKNPFYYGKFEYPVGSKIWYQGKHPPLISRDCYDKVQEQLATYPKAKWGSRKVIFKGLFKCGNCKSNIVGEERWRKRKWAEPRRHVYYHCARPMNQCKERYISEEKLIKQILKYINFMNIAHPHTLNLKSRLMSSVSTYLSIRDEILYEQDINPKSKPLDPVNFARHIFLNGATQEKRDLIIALDRQLYIKNRLITSNPHDDENDLCIST